MDLFSLKNKTILLTGGYGHLGSAIARGLLEAGGQVLVLGKENEKFRNAFSDLNGDIYFKEIDVSSTESIRETFGFVEEKYGIDVLINNAFYLTGQDPEKMNDEEWKEGIEGTLGSVFRCIREIIPFFKEKKRGRIINVSSMYGVVAPDFSAYVDYPQYLNPPHYGAAKAGVIQMTRYYASYLGQFGVTVNAICPGPFPNNEVQKEKGFINELSNRTMLGRIGYPNDLMGAFVFFASDASNYITGETLMVDGGWTSR